MLDLLVRTLPILLGGATVQLIVAMVKRKSEMKTADSLSDKSNAEADAVVVASAEKSLQISDRIRDLAVARAERLATDLAHAESALIDANVELRYLRVEVRTLTRQVERLDALSAGNGMAA